MSSTIIDNDNTTVNQSFSETSSSSTSIDYNEYDVINNNGSDSGGGGGRYGNAITHESFFISGAAIVAFLIVLVIIIRIIFVYLRCKGKRLVAPNPLPQAVLVEEGIVVTNDDQQQQEEGINTNQINTDQEELEVHGRTIPTNTTLAQVVILYD